MCEGDLAGAYTYCTPNCGSRVTTCGYSCPSGYHPVSVGDNLSCGRSGFGAYTTCDLTYASRITVCGYSCPAGYVPMASGDNLSCGRSGFGRYTTCDRL